MGTQTGRGGGGRDVTDGRAHAGGGDRNRDNAMGGGRSGGFGGGLGLGRTASVIGNRFGAPSASAQAAALARNTPPAGFSGGMGGLNARRTANPTPSYDMSLHNMRALAGLMPGVGMAPSVAAMGMGFGPQFQGSRGIVNGPGDYDPTNRFGTNESAMMQARPKMGVTQPAARPPMAAQPGLMAHTGPSQWLTNTGASPGLQPYGVMAPGLTQYRPQGRQNFIR